MKQIVEAILLLSLVIGASDSHSKEFDPNNPLNPPAPIYWCPDRTADRLITTTPETGCRPLIDPEDEKKTGRKEEAAKDPIKILEIQNEASKFVQRYRQFLGC